MKNRVSLVNCNLREYCEPFCAVIENAQFLEQEIKELCLKENISLLKGKRHKITATLINELKQKFTLNEEKINLAKQIINARNQLVHSFFISAKGCMANIKIDNVNMSDNFLKDFGIVNDLIFELRDFFANIEDGGNRPNFIDGKYNPL